MSGGAGHSKTEVRGTKLSDQFFVDLVLLARRHKTDPEVFLTAWAAESWLDPSAVNPRSGARGLNQMLPFKLRLLKAPAEFQTLPGEQQLPWIERMIREGEGKNKGRPFKTAARYFHSNIYPATMVRGESPDAVVFAGDAATEQERKDYAANARNLDPHKRGRVTVGQLEEIMRGIRSDARYANAFARLARAVVLVGGLDTAVAPGVESAPQVSSGPVAASAPDVPVRGDARRSRGDGVFALGAVVLGAVAFGTAWGRR